jgi:uncharacterized membrane protein YbaN (DUF454 family)
MLRRIREVAGLALMVIGVVGSVTPLMPGTVFLLAGIALLGPDHPSVRAVLKRLRLRLKKGDPTVHEKNEKP